MLPVPNDVASKEGRNLHKGLVVFHGLPLLHSKAYNLSSLRRLRRSNIFELCLSRLCYHI